MITTLIDNATASSVQRALGKAQTRDLGIIDVEQTALGRFTESILLSDRVVIPDNYKQQHTPKRKELLSSLGVDFIQVADSLDQDLNNIAKDLSAPWTEAYREGQNQSLFQQYFSQINAYSKFIWQHSSSEFFLVFRAHGIDKESPLIEALLSSPTDEELGKQLRILAKDGSQVSWNRLSRHVQRMLSVMGWMGHQYIWYQVFAARHDFVYSPHPLREFFANDFLSRVDIGASDASSFKSAFTTGIQNFQGTLSQNLKKLGQSKKSISFYTPPLLPVVLNECTNKEDFLTVLKQLKEERNIKELRNTLSEIQNDLNNGKLHRHRQLIDDINNIGKNIFLSRGIDNRFLNLSPPKNIVGIEVIGEGAGIQIPLNHILYKQYFFTRKYRALLRDVMLDLATPSKLGAYKTRLNSWVWHEESSGYGDEKFYAKEYHFPSQFHKPLNHNSV